MSSSKVSLDPDIGRSCACSPAFEGLCQGFGLGLESKQFQGRVFCKFWASGSRPSGFEVVRFRVRGVGPEGLGLGFTWTPQRRAKY